MIAKSVVEQGLILWRYLLLGRDIFLAKKAVQCDTREMALISKRKNSSDGAQCRVIEALRPGKMPAAITGPAIALRAREI
jgi:hypothetical protein